MTHERQATMTKRDDSDAKKKKKAHSVTRKVAMTEIERQ